MNILNYARQLELVNYSKVNENTLNEADADPAKALDQVKSGKVAGSTYAPQWKQVQDAVVKGHEAGQVTGTVKVLHNNQSEMVTVTWTIANGKVTISLVAAADQANPIDLETKAITISTKIKELFVDGSAFFQEFKGNVNDDDIKAATAFRTWFDTFHKKTIDSITASTTNLTDETAKSITTKNIAAINAAVNTIVSKMKSSGDANDDVSWSITKLDGTVVPFKVDTDF